MIHHMINDYMINHFVNLPRSFLFLQIMEENEAQMRLAIEERELSKMAAVMKQDNEMQDLLSETEDQLKSCRDELDAEKRRFKQAEEVYETEKTKLASDMDVSELLFLFPKFVFVLNVMYLLSSYFKNANSTILLKYFCGSIYFFHFESS